MLEYLVLVEYSAVVKYGAVVVEHSALAEFGIEESHLEFVAGDKVIEALSHSLIYLVGLRTDSRESVLAHFGRLIAWVAHLDLFTEFGIALVLFALDKLLRNDIELSLTVVHKQDCDAVAGLFGEFHCGASEQEESLFELFLTRNSLRVGHIRALGYLVLFEQLAVGSVAAEIVDIAVRLELGVVEADEHLLREHHSECAAEICALLLELILGAELYFGLVLLAFRSDIGVLFVALLYGELLGLFFVKDLLVFGLLALLLSKQSHVFLL